MLGELLEVLAERGVTLSCEGDRLRYRGPRLAPGDPVHLALATFHDEVAWLVASARLCVICPRPLADGDRTCCEEHRREVDATPRSCGRRTAKREDR